MTNQQPLLPWPHYADGTPFPADANGQPIFNALPPQMRPQPPQQPQRYHVKTTMSRAQMARMMRRGWELEGVRSGGFAFKDIYVLRRPK